MVIRGKKASDYLSGSPIRQDYLSTVLQWIADYQGLTSRSDEGDTYMANHQGDDTATEIKNCYVSVMEWVGSKFKAYRKEMKGLPWGYWYNKYHSEMTGKHLKGALRGFFFYKSYSKPLFTCNLVINLFERRLNMYKLAEALFKTRATIKLTGDPVNKKGFAGISISEYRPTGAKGEPKMSSAARLFDKLLLEPGEVGVWSNVGSTLVRLKGGNFFFVEDDGCTVRSTIGDNPTNSESVLPLVLHVMAHGENAEMVSDFKDVVGAFEKDPAEVNNQNLFRFCDSFYYKNAKSVSVDFRPGALTDPEIEAGFRSGLFEEVTDLQSIAGKFFAEAPYPTAPKAEESKKSTTATSDFLKDCMEGKYILPYSWDEKVKGKIISPDFLKTFQSTPQFERIVKKIFFHAKKIIERMDRGLTGAEAIGNDALNILLLGKPGTGKTTLAYALSATLGMPVCTTVHSKYSDVDEYQGKTAIVDGHPEFVTTDALLFHEYGGIDVNEEINLADPSVTMGGLGQKLVYPFIVKKNGVETVVRHPLNVIIGTMNVGTNGSNPLNQALQNRFGSVVLLNDPTKSDFIGMLMKSSGESEELCTWVYDVYCAIVSELCDPEVGAEEVCDTLSVRTCLGAIQNMQEGCTDKEALEDSFIGNIAGTDLALAETVRKEVLTTLRPAPL